MDVDILLSLVLAFFGWAAIYFLTSRLSFGKRARLPPGPYPFPVIGNIFQLGQNPNQSLTKLAKTYGPLMSLKLGSNTTVVVSSPAVAREVLQKNDQVFSSRIIPHAAEAHAHHKYSMVWLQVSGLWRNLRKISKEHMFAAQRLDASEGLRQEKLQELHDYLVRCSTSNKAVNFGQTAFTTSLNFISSTFFSVDFAAYGSDSSQEFKDIVWRILKSYSTPNVADYFPVLKFMDPQGILQKNTFLFSKMFDIFDNIINERLMMRGSLDTSKKNDLLEALLNHSANNESEFSLNELKHMLLVSFLFYFLVSSVIACPIRQFLFSLFTDNKFPVHRLLSSLLFIQTCCLNFISTLLQTDWYKLRSISGFISRRD